MNQYLKSLSATEQVGAMFLIVFGCLAIAGLPPLNGFVSEWLTFQAALQSWQLDSGVLRSLIPVAAAVLALTSALAAAGFVRVYGIAFLGRARSRHVRRARPESRGMRLGQGLLAAGCVAAGLLPTPLIGVLGAVPQQLLGTGLPQATARGWLWLTPIAPEVASYSAPALALALAVAMVVAAWALRRGALRRVRRGDPWDCGFGPLTPRMQYSATAFAQPVRRVFAPLFAIDAGVELEAPGRLRYRLVIGDRLWKLLYAPFATATDGAARRVARLQSGNVRRYLGWTLATLLVLLWIIT